MPFKRVGRRVLVKKKGKWVLKKEFVTEAAAEKFRIALVLNVDVAAEKK